MNKPVVLITLIIPLTLLQGCAYTVETPSPGTPVSGQFFSIENPTPAAAVISSHIYKKIHQKAAIFISDEELASQYDSHFGLVGYLFPYRVYPGKILKAYADVYLSKLFDRISFKQQDDDNFLLSLKIINFDISAVSKAAQLEISLNIRDKANQLLFEKNIAPRAKATSHFI